MTNRLSVLVDWKSGLFRAPEHRLQLGGYARCPSQYDKDTGLVLPLDRSEVGAVIHLNTDGIWPLTVLTGEELVQAGARFVEAVSIYRYLALHGAIPGRREDRYHIQGQPYVSVTQVLQYVIAKPGLLNWYAKMAKEGKSPDQERDKKAVAGSTIHKLVMFYLQGKKVTVENDKLAGLMVTFGQWCAKVDAKPLETETTVFDAQIGVAGTLDTRLSVDQAKWQTWVEAAGAAHPPYMPSTEGVTR
jgi:hypothetical protein